MTSREYASLILLGVLIATALAVPSIRRVTLAGFGDVLRSFLKWKVLLPFFALGLWTALAVYCGSMLGIWTAGLLKDTVLVFLGLAMPLLFTSVSAKSGGFITKQLIEETVGATVVLVAYVNLVSLPLWGELLVQALASFLLLLSASARRSPQSTVVAKGVGVLLSTVGLVLLTYTTVQLVVAGSKFDWIAAAESFFLTLWLPLALFPFLYAMGFVSQAEMALMRATRVGRFALSRRMKWSVLLGLRGRIALAASVTPMALNLEEVSGFKDTAREMRRFRRKVAEAREEHRRKVSLLRENAGVRGVDEFGAQLDRREFRVTKDRLRWIATTQSGRFEANGGQYWDDLTDWMVDAERHNLPQEHGFHTEVRDDGLAWRSWRATPSGWVLGVGGRERHDDYYFAGPVAPGAWPGDGEAWVDGTRADLPVDWRVVDVE
ncbi:hypothetical protein NYQ31_02965 [Curtobacterium flaccumfaciens]|uniref:hypothetical protein n=1 Tax=Curtobacterium flaccumfaciens TaxID=2035 RepID=UPI00217F0FA0|nr:hypothetical protein [Curtobacterium flaccumfaciens]MCS6557355.1 hypothetical protein [Curtobacterium flaccumfaciens]